MKDTGLKVFEGYLFAKLARLGSKSEGPEYYLQMKDGKELLVLKKTELWEEDPALEEFLGERVEILGEWVEKGIEYKRVKLVSQPWRQLNVSIQAALPNDILWVAREPGPKDVRFPQPLRSMKLALEVEWPYRSIWRGECPTTQLFDFWIYGPDGRELWQWSESMIFVDEPIVVEVPGGAPHHAKVVWCFYDHAIPAAGEYLIRAIFLPSGQKVEKVFEVKFAVMKEVETVAG